MPERRAAEAPSDRRLGGRRVIGDALIERIVRLAPRGSRPRLRRLFRPAWLGTLRRTVPLDPQMGFGRGTPIDRYYIERFLEAHRADMRGRALEVKSADYLRRFGVNVTSREVLDIDPGNPRATIVADLARADVVATDSFDCFVLTQTLQVIYDTRAAVAHAHRILRPGGVLLATVPAVSAVLRNAEISRDYWRFTQDSCAELFGEAFGPGRVTVRTYGSVLTCIAFLAAMAREELSRSELEAHDPLNPLLVVVRAVKAGG